jgi:hypothetical protein
MVSLEKNIIIYLKLQANTDRKIFILIFVTFPEARRRLSHDVGYPQEIIHVQNDQECVDILVPHRKLAPIHHNGSLQWTSSISSL